MSDASAAGTAIRPSGTVSFSKAAGDAGSLGAASCTLPATGANECSVTYTPSAAGSSTITGSYGGDVNHLTSSDDDTVTAAKRDSATTVTCSPASVVINQASTCTAAVSDASAAGTSIRPTGTVNFSKAAGDAGTLGAASCTLPASGANQCSVTYTPSATGSSTITGSYGGDTNHLTSSDDDTVTAAKRATATTVTCTSPVAINQGSTCSATVDDTDVGTKGIPAGTVTFSNAAGDPGSFGSTTCSLDPIAGDGDSARCSVTYTPSDIGDPHHRRELRR